MRTIDEALEAIRTVESDKNYTRQQKVRVGGVIDTKVGAYGILESRWRTLAADAGVAGATWQDPAAQDSIARQKLQRDYDELGSWELAALAFRYGTQAARAMGEAGYIEPQTIESAGYAQMGQYLRDLRAMQPDPERKVEGQLPTPANVSAKQAAPTRVRAENIVRTHLRTMLGAGNSMAAQNEAVAAQNAPEEAEVDRQLPMDSEEAPA